MDQSNDDRAARRRVLTLATGAMGLIGAVFASVPFVRSLSPSARARARGGPVTIDIQRLEVGQQMSALWRGKPIWVLHRDEEMLEGLGRENLVTQLTDPDSATESQQPGYTQNPYRSIRPEYLVAIGLCTHLGCVPSFRPEAGSVNKEWPGGYFCPCHGSKFDLAGRVYRNVPAPTNLVIPPHRYLDDNMIQVGVDTETA